MDLEKRQTLDMHWPYIAPYIEHTVECTLHTTLHCVHWPYTGVYSTVHWCTLNCTLDIWWTGHQMCPHVSQMHPAMHLAWISFSKCVQLCSRYFSAVFPLCTWPVYLILQMCSRCVLAVSNCALGLYRCALECLLDCTLECTMYTGCTLYYTLYTVYIGCAWTVPDVHWLYTTVHGTVYNVQVIQMCSRCVLGLYSRWVLECTQEYILYCEKTETSTSVSSAFSLEVQVDTINPFSISRCQKF